ncbi:MAG: hypothetical protein ACRCXT_03180 [Paraclostridium sp.]
MDEKKLWLKISGSITYYFKCYNRKLSNEELWLDYVDYALPAMDGEGVHTYLDKQSLERIVVDDVMMDKSKVAFMERLEKRRSNEKPIKEEKRGLAPVVDFLKFKK